MMYWTKFIDSQPIIGSTVLICYRCNWREPTFSCTMVHVKVKNGEKSYICLDDTIYQDHLARIDYIVTSSGVTFRLSSIDIPADKIVSWHDFTSPFPPAIEKPAKEFDFSILDI